MARDHILGLMHESDFQYSNQEDFCKDLHSMFHVGMSFILSYKITVNVFAAMNQVSRVTYFFVENMRKFPKKP